MAQPCYVNGQKNASYRSRQIVVANAHSEAVIDTLSRAGARPVVVDRGEDLGLTLLSVSNVTAATGELVDRTEPAHRARLPRAASADDLDPLLTALRAQFAGEHGGWRPTVGKNRYLGQVFGGDGIVNHGTGGRPSWTADDTPFPARTDGAGAGVVVGLLDTPIWPHRWLAGGWVGGPADQLPDTGEYAPADGHATFLTGLILSQAPSARVLVRHVLPAGGQGAEAWTVAKEIVRLGNSGIDVLNLSLICQTEDGDAPLTLRAAVDRVPPNVVIVAAAGNHGALSTDPVDGPPVLDPRSPAFPAALDRVIAVGASTRDGRITPFTPRDAQWVELVALGDEVVSTYLDGAVRQDDHTVDLFTGWARWSGTSVSAALISGAIAARVKPGTTPRDALRQLYHGRRIQPGGPGSTWRPHLVDLGGPFASEPPADRLAHGLNRRA
jgi:hypothetical protein